MKTRARELVEAVKLRLESIMPGVGFINTVFIVDTSGDFDQSQLDQGVCINIAFAGESKRDSQPHTQLEELTLVVEAHKTVSGSEVALYEGLDLLGDLKKSLLTDKTYLTGLCRLDLTHIESSSVRQSDDGAAVISTVQLSTVYVEKHSQIFN